MDTARSYWNRVAAAKTFTHPLNRDWLAQTIARGARLLDYGCGYGRTLHDLASLGYTNALGVDFSPEMIARGLREHPALDLRAIQRLPLEEGHATFDAVFLFAVLTCIPDDRTQDAVVGEVRRLLRPGGLLYISDMPLQTDERNRARYARDQSRFGAYGAFETGDGAVVRHFAEERLDALLRGFVSVASRQVVVTTMNGNTATATQRLLRHADR